MRLCMRSVLMSGLRAKVHTMCLCGAYVYNRWLTLTEKRLLVSFGPGEEIRDDMMLLDIDVVSEMESDLL